MASASAASSTSHGRQDQPVGDQRFHETHRRPPGRACSDLTGRGADRSGRRSADASGRRRPPSVITVRCGPDASSARQRPDRVHHLNATQAPTATRATARRCGRLFPAAGPRGDPLGDPRVRCRCAHGQPRAERHPFGVDRRASKAARLGDRDGRSPRDAAKGPSELRVYGVESSGWAPVMARPRPGAAGGASGCGWWTGGNRQLVVLRAVRTRRRSGARPAGVADRPAARRSPG